MGESSCPNWKVRSRLPAHQEAHCPPDGPAQSPTHLWPQEQSLGPRYPTHLLFSLPRAPPGGEGCSVYPQFTCSSPNPRASEPAVCGNRSVQVVPLKQLLRGSPQLRAWCAPGRGGPRDTGGRSGSSGERAAVSPVGEGGPAALPPLGSGFWPRRWEETVSQRGFPVSGPGNSGGRDKGGQGGPPPQALGCSRPPPLGDPNIS